MLRLTPSTSASATMCTALCSRQSVRLVSTATATRTLASSSAATRRVAAPSTIARTLPSLRSFSTSSTRQNEEQKQQMSSGEEEIHTLLTKRFSPTHVQVQDVSGGCGSFYAIVIASKDFQGLTTVKQHRLVNECLKDIIGGIHGLQLKTIPAE